MSQQKRRVVYIDDATWKHAQGFAIQRGTTISEAIRIAIVALPPDSKRQQAVKP